MALKLIGEVALDGSGWDRGLSRMAGSVKGFIATAFGIYGVQSAIQKTVETASELVDASQRLGIGVEPLQVLKRAAKDAGSELDTVVKKMEKVELARAKALTGGKTGAAALAAFRAIGVDEEQLRGMNRQALFTGPIARAVQTMDPSALAEPLKEIFGRAFGELIPVLQTDFQSLENMMRRFGGIMDTETAVALDLLGDQFNFLASIIAVRLGPALLSFLEFLYKAVTGVAATWAYFSSYLSGGRERAQEIMAATPGYGGWSAGQKEGFAAIKPETEAERIAKDEQAKKDALSVFSKMTDWLADTKSKLAEMAERLKNPPPRRSFEPITEAQAPKVKLAKDGGGDALIRVGNFLGASRDVLSDIAVRQLALTQQMAADIRTIATRTATDSGWSPGLT